MRSHRATAPKQSHNISAWRDHRTLRGRNYEGPGALRPRRLYPEGTAGPRARCASRRAREGPKRPPPRRWLFSAGGATRGAPGAPLSTGLWIVLECPPNALNGPIRGAEARGGSSSSSSSSCRVLRAILCPRSALCGRNGRGYKIGTTKEKAPGVVGPGLLQNGLARSKPRSSPDLNIVARLDPVKTVSPGDHRVSSNGKRQGGRRPKGGDESAIIAQLSKEERWWRAQERYGSKGTQALFINPQIFNPSFLPGFTANELFWMQAVHFVCRDWRSWRVMIAEPFLRAGLNGRGNDSHGFHVRCKEKWEHAGFIRPVEKCGKSKFHIVAPILSTPYAAEKLAHYHAAQTLLTRALDQARRERLAAERERRRLEAEKRKAMLDWAAEARKATKEGREVPEPWNSAPRL